jgi:hypothetical protein
MADEDDMPEMQEEHVHTDKCDDDKKANLDDLDVEASK